LQAVTIASTEDGMDDQAELAYVAGWLRSETVYLPEGCHPSHY